MGQSNSSHFGSKIEVMHSEGLLTGYLVNYYVDMKLAPTMQYGTEMNALTLGSKGQRSKVKGRGHSGVKHVGNSTVLHSWRHTALDAATKLVSGQFNKTVQL